MSDAIRRLPPKMCPFCELFDRQPQPITPGPIGGMPHEVGGVPSCQQCSDATTGMPAIEVVRIYRLADAVQYLRERNYQIARDGEQWHVSCKQFDDVLSDDLLVGHAEFLQNIDVIGTVVLGKVRS